jgi:hypothetical protein
VSVSLVAQATGIAQALDCLAGVRPWVQLPVPPN